MGVFRYPIALFSPQGQRPESLEALLDTEASYTVVPGSVLRRLGGREEWQRDFILGDGRRVTLSVGVVDTQIDGRRMPTVCVFGEEASEPLLGAATREQLGLGVDPLGQRLVQVPGYLV